MKPKKRTINFLIKVILATFKMFKRQTRKRIAFSLASLIFKLAAKTRKRAVSNVAAAMPALSIKEAEEIALLSYKNIVFGVLECFWLDEVEFEFEISPSAQEILDSGSGASIATMHMGCYEAVPCALQQLTQRSTTMSKIPTFLTSGQQVYNRMKVNCIDKNQTGGFLELLKQIRTKQIVSLHSDHFGDDVQLNFFQRKTGAPCGAAMLSAYGKAPLLLGYSILQPNGKYKVYLETVSETPISLEKTAFQEAMKAVYQRFETIILQYPEHWYWSYKRWR